ncbi:hypothetical protein PMAYCL1PPCAC_26420, partial [Pristionchus mayeri]
QIFTTQFSSVRFSMGCNRVDMDQVEESKLGTEALDRGDYATAHVHYDNAIRLVPTNANCYLDKADVFYKEHK